MKLSIAIGITFAASLLISERADAQLSNLFGSSIEVIDTDSLQKKLEDRKRVVENAKAKGEAPPPSDFVVVDVRSDAEIDVSIIPGAITKAAFEKDPSKYREMTVIPYCLVGGRSTSYAKKLVSQKYKVLNYKPSILGWVNAKLPLTTLNGESTTKVHVAPSRYSVPDGYQRVK